MFNSRTVDYRGPAALLDKIQVLWLVFREGQFFVSFISQAITTTLQVSFSRHFGTFHAVTEQGVGVGGAGGAAVVATEGVEQVQLLYHYYSVLVLSD